MAAGCFHQHSGGRAAYMYIEPSACRSQRRRRLGATVWRSNAGLRYHACTALLQNSSQEGPARRNEAGTPPVRQGVPTSHCRMGKSCIGGAGALWPKGTPVQLDRAPRLAPPATPSYINKINTNPPKAQRLLASPTTPAKPIPSLPHLLFSVVFLSSPSSPSASRKTLIPLPLPVSPSNQSS